MSQKSLLSTIASAKAIANRIICMKDLTAGTVDKQTQQAQQNLRHLQKQAATLHARLGVLPENASKVEKASYASAMMRMGREIAQIRANARAQIDTLLQSLPAVDLAQWQAPLLEKLKMRRNEI